MVVVVYDDDDDFLFLFRSRRSSNAQQQQQQPHQNYSRAGIGVTAPLLSPAAPHRTLTSRDAPRTTHGGRVSRNKNSALDFVGVVIIMQFLFSCRPAARARPPMYLRSHKHWCASLLQPAKGLLGVEEEEANTSSRRARHDRKIDTNSEH